MPNRTCPNSVSAEPEWSTDIRSSNDAWSYDLGDPHATDGADEL